LSHYPTVYNEITFPVVMSWKWENNISVLYYCISAVHVWKLLCKYTHSVMCWLLGCMTHYRVSWFLWWLTFKCIEYVSALSCVVQQSLMLILKYTMCVNVVEFFKYHRCRPHAYWLFIFLFICIYVTWGIHFKRKTTTIKIIQFV